MHPTVDQPGTRLRDGRVRLTLTFECVAYAYTDLAPLAGAVEVVAPQELRDLLAQAGRDLAARYGGT